MSNFTSDFEVIRTLGEPALLEQLAEECSELAQAALKLARLERGENPTPKTEDECVSALNEEMADVCLCMDVIKCVREYDLSNVGNKACVKMERWVQRIREARGEVQKETPGEKKKTRQSEFLKMFPNAQMDDGVAAACPSRVDKNFNCCLPCDDCRKDFWLAEAEAR